MEDNSSRPKEGWQPPAIFHIIGLIAAVLAVAVTIFFSARAERNKALTLKYFGERPLLSFQSRASAELAVTLAGQRLQAPWLFSGRLENTGNQPIESRDIESPLQLTFEKGKVVSVEIVDKSQQAIVAKASHDDSVVTISHTLLNPGDWIGFDILFDGQPSHPSASLRISGVPELRQATSPIGGKRVYATVITLPAPALYFELIIGSLSALLLVGVGISVAISTAREAIRPNPTFAASNGERMRSLFEETALLSRLEPETTELKAVFLMLKMTPELSWLDEPKRLEELVQKRVPGAMLMGLSLNPSASARKISIELKESLQRRLAHLVLSFSPEGPDKELQQKILGLDLAHISSAELIATAKSAAGSQPLRPPKLDKGQVAGSLVMIGVGVCLAMVLGGTWRTLLGL